MKTATISSTVEPIQNIKTDCLVLLINPMADLSAVVSQINDLCENAVQQLIEDGDLGDAMGNHSFISRPENMACKRIMLFNMGAEASKTQASNRKVKKMLSKLAARCVNARASSVCIALDDYSQNFENKTLTNYWIVNQLVLAIHDHQYKFDYYKTNQRDSSTLVTDIELFAATNQVDDYNRAILHGNAIGSGCTMTKDLGNQPPNICHPAYLKQCAEQLAKESMSCAAPLTVNWLDTQAMQNLGMDSLLSVAKGSDQPPYLITLEYKGGKAGDVPVALVGKGVTFDTGGISLKPGLGMDEMKYDMCGAATVLGVMKAVYQLQLPMNIVAVVAAVENMPSGCASRPGDIVTSMSGKTIEILNTDAEGRLILCDALTYTQTTYKPETIIDIATLTGACVIALGNHASGMYSNNQMLADKLLNAGEQIEDRAWQMPLWPEYTAQLKSPFADLANIGGKTAGSVTAACFLAEFCKECDWAHLDIAGTAWKSGSQKGATARPVPLLCQFLLDYC